MANKQELREARELTDLNVKEVSLVDKPAILREFLVTKRSEEEMPFREKAKEDDDKATSTEEEAKAEHEEEEEEEKAEAPEEKVEGEEKAEHEEEEEEEAEEEAEEEEEEKSDMSAALKLALPLFEEAAAKAKGDVKEAAESVLSSIRRAVESVGEEEKADDDEAQTEKADEPVEKARRMTASRRVKFSNAIAALQGLLKDFDGEDAEEKKDEKKEKEETTTKRAGDPMANAEELASTIAELVLKRIEPRLEETEKRVSGVEETIPAPRSARPEPTEVPVRKAKDVPTSELFDGVF